MAKVVFVVGLAGSGKTRLSQKLVQDENYAWVEALEHDKRQNVAKVVAHLKAGRDCVAEELQALTPHYRQAIEAELKREVPGTEVEFRFFENSLDKANANVRSRPEDKKTVDAHLDINTNVQKHYVIPKDATVLSIDGPTEYVEPVETKPKQ